MRGLYSWVKVPGYDEDQKGEPFVGKAGQLLTKIIQAMNLTREQGIYLQYHKVPPAGKQEPGAGRDKGLFSVS